MHSLSNLLRAMLGLGRRGYADQLRTGRTAAHRDIRWGVVLRNGPFLVGSAVVLALIILVAIGPSLASENPYYAGLGSIETVEGQIVTAPFAPSPRFPLGSDRWGRDMLSLLLYGARNTLVACAFVTMVRVALGLGLGALAGWRAGGYLDRLIMGMVEILSSLPMLLTGMILILALDVRRGLVAFLIALCLIGWGEVAQMVRGEFIALRERPFIEGARVVGVRDSGIVWRHIFPSVLPTLVVLTLMEMGSVLMLLGELAFVGIFIGGGSLTTDVNDRTAVIADIPEWGAVLADARGYMRSYPWMVLSPSAAFFVSVLGFNLLGEGLRRITRDAGVNTASIISSRIVVIGATIALATWYIAGQIGPNVSYAKLAYGFEGQRALDHAEVLVGLQQGDPGFGSAGAEEAANYIAEQFEAYGLLPAAQVTSFLQPVERKVARRLSTPSLEVLAEDGSTRLSLAHGADFGEQVYNHGGSGQAEGPLVFVGLAAHPLDYGAYRGLDLNGKIAVILKDDRSPAFDSEALIRGARALLVITDDAEPHTDWAVATGSYMQNPQFPILHVRPEAADRLLADSGYDVAALREEVASFRERQDSAGWFTLPLGVQARTRVQLSEPKMRTGYNVLGILTGTDTSLDREAFLVSTSYDFPEPDPGAPFVAAGEGPAGVGVMLEMLRLWHEQGFQPRRTILVAAWSGGYLSRSGAATYVEERSLYTRLERQAVLHLGNVGSGGSTLRMSSGTAGLGALAAQGCQKMGVAREEGLAPSRPYEREIADRSTILRWKDAPGPYSGRDLVANLDADRLGQAGNLVTYVLVTASRQFHY